MMAYSQCFINFGYVKSVEKVCFLNHLPFNYCHLYSFFMFPFVDAQNNSQQSDCAMATSDPQIILSLTPILYPATSPNSEPSLEPASTVPVHNSTWVSNFAVPWKKTHENSRSLSQGKRSEAADERHMVRVIADAIREVCLNPRFRQCAELAKSIVYTFPIKSFEDRTEEDWEMDITL